VTYKLTAKAVYGADDVAETKSFFEYVAQTIDVYVHGARTE